MITRFRLREIHLTETESQVKAATRPRNTGRAAELSDNAGLVGDLLLLVWHHKLWWLVPVLVVMLLLGLLLVLQATPVGPLLYPVF